MNAPGIGEDLVEHLKQFVRLDLQKALRIFIVVRLPMLLSLLLVSGTNKMMPSQSSTRYRRTITKLSCEN